MTATHPLTTTAFPLNELTTYHRNPRRGNVPAIAASLQTIGQYRPIVVNLGRLTGRPLEVLAGNHTLLAARHLGWDTITGATVDVDDETAARIVAADNRTADLGDYDLAQLAELLADLPDLTGTGYTDDDLAKLAADLAGPETGVGGDPALDDEVPEPPAEPVTRPGDVWQLGRHRIVCGDCRDPGVVERALGGAVVNVAFTSPPYASQRNYDETTEFRPIPPDDYVDWFEQVQANVRAHLADDGSWFVNIKAGVVDGERHLYANDLLAAHKRTWRWAFIDEYAWVRPTPPGAWPNRFKNGWEPVYHFGPTPTVKFRPKAVAIEGETIAKSSEAGAKHDGPNGLYWNLSHESAGKGAVLPFNVITVSGVDSGMGHAAAFPTGLPRWFVRAFSDPGDVIFDPFMGSGTTLIAAHREDRTAIGTELSPAYCDVICARYQAATGTLPILEATGEPHDFTQSSEAA
jgi:DNA modification methylase